ncbi:hypothetical protein V3C99_013681 [Haemonchus contortus]
MLQIYVSSVTCIDALLIICVSRCTYSCKDSAASAPHERDIANYFCNIASRRTMNNLKEAAHGNEYDVKLIASIAKAVCKNGGLPTLATQKRPSRIV